MGVDDNANLLQLKFAQGTFTSFVSFYGCCFFQRCKNRILQVTVQTKHEATRSCRHRITNIAGGAYPNRPRSKTGIVREPFATASSMELK